MAENNVYKICCFAGHSDIQENKTKEKIKDISQSLILNHGVKEFWVGNYGNFDACSAAAIRELKKIYNDIKLILVIPYLTKKITEYKEEYYKMYNGILIADIPENTPKRFFITKANEYMVNNSDYLICYVQRSYGGAANTYKNAKRKNLKIINIAEEMTP